MMTVVAIPLGAELPLVLDAIDAVVPPRPEGTI